MDVVPREGAPLVSIESSRRVFADTGGFRIPGCLELRPEGLLPLLIVSRYPSSVIPTPVPSVVVPPVYRFRYGTDNELGIVGG